MHPLGLHIKISQPEPINKTVFIIEKEPSQKATVLNISPDISVPFLPGSTIAFYTDRHVVSRGEIFIHEEMILGYE